MNTIQLRQPVKEGCFLLTISGNGSLYLPPLLMTAYFDYHLKPSEISGGMQKRVGIARAITLRPKYLFCDEPNSGLDPQIVVKIDELIFEIPHEFNITTVVVTYVSQHYTHNRGSDVTDSLARFM